MYIGDIKDYYSSNSIDRSRIHDNNMLDVLTSEVSQLIKNFLVA